MGQSSRKLRTVVDEITAEYPGVTVEITVAKHYRITFRYNGRSRFAIAPASPSDRRGELNMRSTLRKVLRELTNDKV